MSMFMQRHYDERYRETYWEELKSANYVRYQIFEKIVEKLRLKEKVVLDFGCGAGLYTPLLTKVGAIVIGIDVSRVGVNKAHLKAKSNQQNAHFIIADGEKLPFRNKIFDIVFITEVLEHLLNPLKAIEETSRVLKKNGILLGSMPCANKFSVEWIMTWLLGGPRKTKDGLQNFWPDWGTEHLQRFTSKEIKNLYRQMGVNVDTFIYYDHFLHHFCRLLTLLKKFGVILRNKGKIEHLDFKLFKKFPNGTGMVIIGAKLD